MMMMMMMSFFTSVMSLCMHKSMLMYAKLRLCTGLFTFFVTLITSLDGPKRVEILMEYRLLEACPRHSVFVGRDQFVKLYFRGYRQTRVL